MATCEHREVASAFCPDCGEEIIRNRYGALLNYLRRNQKTHEAILSRRIDAKFHERGLMASRRNIAKWKSWADFVEAAIKDYEQKGQ